MATIRECKPGGWYACVFVPAIAHTPGRQVGKIFHGTKKAVRREVALWKAEVRGHARSSVGATVADLLTMWQEARAHDWQPLTASNHRSRAVIIIGGLGTVRLSPEGPDAPRAGGAG